jgi:hypothetical protein
MLEVNPTARITSEEALKHEFFELGFIEPEKKKSDF